MFYSEKEKTIIDDFKNKNLLLNNFIFSLEDPLKNLAIALILIGEERLFLPFSGEKKEKEGILFLLKKFYPAHLFYKENGGLSAYISFFKECLKETADKKTAFLEAPFFDLTSLTPENKSYLQEGIRELPSLAMVFVVGGAGDRLNLTEKKSGKPLPAAEFRYRGCTLLETLFKDLACLEALYEKIYKKKIFLPVVLMTSEEKENDKYIREILKKNHFFGRAEEEIYIFSQPLMPVLDETGKVALKEVYSPYLKPGGHGALWKLMEENNVFAWLKKRGAKKGFIRQINNPLAFTDFGLLAFFGIGFKEKKIFGFYGAERPIGAKEGMNVVVEERTKEGFSYALTNVEYTLLKQNGIEEKEGPKKGFSSFPANTNLLFFDIEEIEKNVEKNPFPGAMINLKTKFSVFEEDKQVEKHGGRVETTMQNIADILTFSSTEKKRSFHTEDFPSYLTYFPRGKTISATKRQYEKDSLLEDTPEKAFLEEYKNAYALLENCQFKLPVKTEEETFLKEGLSFIWEYRKTLGPLFNVIEQKIKGGALKQHAEWVLNLSEVSIKNIEMEGSFLVHGEDQEDYLLAPRLFLENVTIKNKGIKNIASTYWKLEEEEKEREEAFYLFLEEGAEFYAKNVVFTGSLEIHVPEYTRIEAIQTKKGIEYRTIKKKQKEKPQWFYEYDPLAFPSIRLLA